jgi:DNA-binding NtrC family response regulator
VSSAEKKRVLVVDDEHTIADTLVAIFSLAGYEGRAAYSAEGALELIPSWPPHLAIVDVIPSCDERGRFRDSLKAMSPDCTVRLFSGEFPTSQLLEAAHQKGHAFEIFAKPVHPSAFLDLASGLFPPGEVSN